MSVRRVQLRRGTTAENEAFTGAVGEITIDTTKKTILVHDGATQGGTETLKADMSNLGTNALAVDGTISVADSAGDATVRITNLATPTANNDAATKAYVDLGGSANLNDIDDVTIAGVADAQVLVYDNDGGDADDQWKNVTLSGDVTITNAGVSSIGADKVITAKILDDNVTNAKLENSSLTVGSTSISLGAGSTTLAGMTGIDFTVEHASIAANIGAKTLTLGGGTSTVAIANDMTIAGDLTVNGDTTTVNTATLDVEDTVIRLNKGVAGGANTNDIGLFLERGTTGNDAVIFWDEGDDIFKLGTTTDAHTATDFGGNLTLGELQLLTLTATGAGTFGTTVGVTGLLNADGGIEIDNGGNKFTVSTGGAVVSVGGITDTTVASSFKTGTTIGNLVLADGAINSAGNDLDFGAEDLTTSGNVSTTGAGTLTIAGTSALNDNVTVASNKNLNIKKGATHSLLLNSDVVTDNTPANAVIGVALTNGPTYATLTWTNASSTWAFSNNVSTATDLTVGQDLIVTRNINITDAVGSTGITFRHDEADDENQTLIRVDRGATYSSLVWDTSSAYFSVTDGLNVVGAITQGAVDGASNFSVSNTGVITTDSVGHTIANFTINNGSIASGTDAITFGNDTLTTTGVCDFGATTVDSLDASGGGITLAGAISGVSSIAGSDLDINLTDNEATSLEVKGDVKANGTQSYLTFVTTNTTEEVVFNQGGVDIDFRVEGDGNANLIFAQASNDRVGIKTAAPAYDLDITGTLGVSGLADLNGGIDVNASVFTVSNTGATVITTTLGVTGISTLDDTLKVKSAPTDGNAIIFNSDRTDVAKGGANTDVSLLFVKGGDNGTDAYLKWDDSADSFTVDGGKFHSNTNFSVGTAIGTQNFTVSTGGAVVSVGGITDTTVASSFFTGTTIGNLTLTNGKIASPTLAFHSDGDILFRVDENADGDNKFTFQNGLDAEIASIDEAGVLTIAGDANINGGDLTVKAADATNAVINIQSSLGTANGDSWTITGSDEGTRTLTISGQKTGDASYQGVLTLTSHDTATSSNASFAGDVTVLGGKINLTEGSIIDSTTAGTLLLTEDIVKTSADLQVGGNDIKNANADTVITFAGAGFSTTLTATTTILSGDLRINNNIIQNSEGTTTLTMDTDEMLTVAGDLTVGGNDIVLGVGTSTATTIKAPTQTAGNTDGATLTLSSGRGVGTGDGGDLVLQTAGANGAVLAPVLTLTHLKKATFAGDIDFSNGTILGASVGNTHSMTLGGHTGSTVITAGDLTVTGNTLDFGSGATIVNTDNATLTITEATTAIVGNLTVSGVIQNSSAVSTSLLFKDPTVYLGYQSTADDRDVGFVGAYGDTNSADYLMGMVYETADTAGGKGGVFKVFHGRASVAEPADTYAVPDGDLSTVDLGTLRGGSALGADNTAGTTLTISGGASTGNATGGAIEFKTGGSADGGASVENARTLAMTIEDDQEVTIDSGSLTITKTTGLTGDEGASNNPLLATNTKSFQVTATIDTAIADDAHSIDFLVNNTSALSTSVILATCQDKNVEVYAHTIVNATSFKFCAVNRTGGELSADATLVINFVIL